MKRHILILFLVFCCFSCHTRHNPRFSEKLIEDISKESISYPSRFSREYFFCKCQNNEILSLDIYGLRKMYREEYSDMDYSVYLTKLFNQKIVVKCRRNSRMFKINKEVEIQYKHMDIDEFVDFYCTKNGLDLFYLKKYS